MATKDSQYLEALWKAWIETNDNDIANELMEHYMYLVQYHVDRMSSTLPDSVEKSELKSLGLVGLYDALHKFELERNLKFDTYATIRIRGAIIDGLRREDWLPRGLRDQTKQIERTTEQLEQQLHRAPTALEIASVLNMEADEVEEIIQHALFSNVISMDQTIKTNNELDESVTLNATIVDDELLRPEEELIHEELKEELVESIKQLNDNEQLVISLFYIEELTLTEIGEILDLTTSRISQIHKRAIFKLREIINKIA